MSQPKGNHVWARWAVAGVFVGALYLATASMASAQTADGQTPAVEIVCDGLPEAEFGLCNAYCEALDCDSRENPMKACESLRSNYFEHTGSSAFPCDVTCPEVPGPGCSGNGFLGLGDDGCEVCICDEGWSGSDCATCEAGFDSCGICGGNDVCGA